MPNSRKFHRETRLAKQRVNRLTAAMARSKSRPQRRRASGDPSGRGRAAAPDLAALRAGAGRLPWDLIAEFAVFGCVHGDLASLERVVEDAGRRGVYRFLHVGDLLGGDPTQDSAVVERVIELGARGVMGHVESEVLEAGRAAQLTPRARTAVEELPPDLRLELGGLSAHLFHGSPRRVDERLGVSTRDHFLARIGRRLEADILVYGHTHRAYVRHVGSRVFMNVGAVTATAKGPSYGILRLGGEKADVQIILMDREERPAHESRTPRVGERG